MAKNISEKTTARRQPPGGGRGRRQEEVAKSVNESTDDTALTVGQERIGLRAYEIYLSRGATDGRALDDWLQAERELTEGGPWPLPGATD